MQILKWSKIIYMIKGGVGVNLFPQFRYVLCRYDSSSLVLILSQDMSSTIGQIRMEYLQTQ